MPLMMGLVTLRFFSSTATAKHKRISVLSFGTAAASRSRAAPSLWDDDVPSSVASCQHEAREPSLIDAEDDDRKTSANETVLFAPPSRENLLRAAAPQGDGGGDYGLSLCARL